MSTHTDFTKDEKVESLITSIMNRTDYSGKRYLTRYDKEWLIEMLNGDKLAQVESNFKEYEKKGVDIVDFVKIMLSCFDHKQEETIYIVLALIDLFKGICESMNIKEFVRFQDFTTFIVENLIDKGNNEYILQSRSLPKETRFSEERKKIREIDLNPPLIYGKNQLVMKRILADKILTDSSHHENGEIKCAAYSIELKKLFTLDALSNVIKVYGKNCKKERDIIPKASKNNKDLIIISFSYSEFSQRIGACLKNFTLSFWDASDNFSFEKTINTSLVASDYQKYIWYIDFLKSWATADETGALHIWDISINKVKHSYYMDGDIVKNTGSVHMEKKYQQKKKKILDKKLKQSKKKKRKKRNKKQFYKKSIEIDLEQEIYVSDLAEISYLKIVITASTDRQIRIWDMRDEAKAKILFCLNMVKGGVHQIKYFRDYQVLMVAGYENSIPVFSITPEYYDLTVVGRLVGHLSIVTAINYLPNTPMVISADDNGCIKTWDIRSLQCYQTIELSHRTVISNLIPMTNIGKISFIGCRVNFLEFDTYEMESKKENDVDAMSLYPIRVDINMDKEELIICTRCDLRFYNLKTGRLKKIFKHLISSEEVDELTEFQLIQKNHKFLLSDHKGSINIYNYTTGEKINKLDPHQSEITGLRIDNFNKLFITAGNDSTIKVQRELLGENKLKEQKIESNDIKDEFLGMTPLEALKKINLDRKKEFKQQSEERSFRGMKGGKIGRKGKSKFSKNKGSQSKEGSNRKKRRNNGRINIQEEDDQNYELLRKIENVHKKYKVTLLALSVYHNLIASASIENEVIIYDYEFCKLVGRISFNNEIYATVLEFINGYAILMIGTNDHNLYFVKVTTKDLSSIDIQLIGISDPNFHIHKFELNKDKYRMKKIREMKKDFLEKEKEREKEAKSIFSKTQAKEFMPEPKNPYEECKNSYVDRMYIEMKLSEEIDDNGMNESQYETHLKNIKVEQCLLILALNSGFIVIYEIKDFIAKQKFRQHANRRPNYNPYRLAMSEDFIKQIETNNLEELDLDSIPKTGKHENLDMYKIDHFYAHKSNLTSIKVVKIPDTYILTTSSDRYCKVFKITGELIVAINVNHPLPLMWNLGYDKLFDTRNKVLFGLKVIESIFKRYYNMLYMEGKVFDLKAFLDQYKNSGNDKKKDEEVVEENTDLFKMTGVEFDKKKQQIKKKNNVILMQDEYKPKDFAIGKISKFYRQELIGPNLKQMEAKRRIMVAHQEWIAGLESDKNKVKLLNDPKLDNQIQPFTDDFISDMPKFNEDDERFTPTIKDFIKEMNKISVKSEIFSNHDITKTTLNLKESHRRKIPKLKPKKGIRSAEFYGYASSKSLLDSTMVSVPSLKSTKRRMKQDVDHRQMRKQHATKERNFERKRFSHVLENLDNKLKRSQLSLTKNRNMSLPQLYSINNATNKKIKGNKSGYIKIKNLKSEYLFNKEAVGKYKKIRRRKKKLTEIDEKEESSKMKSQLGKVGLRGFYKRRKGKEKLKKLDFSEVRQSKRG